MRIIIYLIIFWEPLWHWVTASVCRFYSHLGRINYFHLFYSGIKQSSSLSSTTQQTMHQEMLRELSILTLYSFYLRLSVIQCELFNCNKLYQWIDKLFKNARKIYKRVIKFHISSHLNKNLNLYIFWWQLENANTRV